MAVDLEGSRPRYFMERAKAEAQAGNPVHQDVTRPTRRRLMREVENLAFTLDEWHQRRTFIGNITNEMNRVIELPPPLRTFTRQTLEEVAAEVDRDIFLTMLEISMSIIWSFRRDESDVKKLQSILADDLSAFRFRNVGARQREKFELHLIDNEHLHREITDRTFELTRVAELASAQRDYADAWRHYSKGDLDDAVSNAGKAVESACKAVIKKVDSTTAPENLNLGPLVTLLVQRSVIPAAMTGVATHLEQIFRASGGLRNQAGAGAHGSVDLITQEASVALLALRLSGTLISFLSERWQQMK
jgi:hypothetical protein